MIKIGNGIIRGAAAGAAGTTALNATSGLDAALPGAFIEDALAAALAWLGARRASRP